MSKSSQYLVIVLLMFTFVVSSVILIGPVTIRGVPIKIILKFLEDETARNAYLQGNKRELHARLDAIGIEEDIKAFYRPKIQNEVKLDQYIHQIFYNNTGYVGDGYYVNSQGDLALRQLVQDDGFNQWFKLAFEVGLVTSSRQENGTIYVVSPKGEVAPYKEIAAIFPLDMLRSLASTQRQNMPRGIETAIPRLM